jgi:hypothetical protein
MEVFMLRKIIIASTLGLFLATSVVTPASAATIKTGSSCTKAGLTKKVGSKTYVCGKNPYVTPTRNTYMLKACRDTNALYRTVKAAYDDMLEQANIFGYKTLADLGNALGGQEKIDLDTLQKTITDTEALLTRQCRRGA